MLVQLATQFSLCFVSLIALFGVEGSALLGCFFTTICIGHIVLFYIDKFKVLLHIKSGMNIKKFQISAKYFRVGSPVHY